MTRRGTEKKINLRRNDCDGRRIEFQVPVGARTGYLQAVGNVNLELRRGGGCSSWQTRVILWVGQAGMHPPESREHSAPFTKRDAPPPPHWEGPLLPYPPYRPLCHWIGLSTWSENALYKWLCRAGLHMLCFIHLTKNGSVH